MANNSGGGFGEAIGAFLALLIHLVVSLTFPLIAIVLCGLSYVLTYVFHLPQFFFWAFLASNALKYAASNVWAAIALAIFILAAVPLAWIAFREQELKGSRLVRAWITAAVVVSFTCYLGTYPYHPTPDNQGDLFWYGLVLLVAGTTVMDVILSTLGIVLHVRRNRPQPVRPPQHAPHGAPHEERRPSGEPETI
jgi:hypothetical protein